MPNAPKDQPVARAPALQARIREEQIALLLRSSRHSSPTAFVIALAFWAFLYFRLHDPWVLAWAVLMHAGQLTRYVWVLRHHRYASDPQKEQQWMRGFLGLIGLNGATWGLAPLLFFPANDAVLTAFLVLVVLAIYSGGLAWMAPIKAAVICFSIPIVSLLTLSLLVQVEVTYKVAACLTFLYGINSWTYALQHHKLLSDALAARFENLDLIAQLQEQMALVEKVSQEKSRFLAAASHDLRQPIHAIALFTAVLEKALRGGAQHDVARRLAKAVGLLGNSLDGMLDISRLDAGTVTAASTAVPLQRLFEALDSVFSPQANARGLQLRIRATELWVQTDAELMQRMLSNLLSNALKYTEAGGVVLRARLRGDQVWVDVRDTGVGIAPEQQERIFDEFYQVGNAGRDRSQGLGIGLAIVRRLSRLLGHPLHIASRPGRGSCFRVLLARAQPAPAPFQPERSGGFTVAGALPQRVLVLDDELDIQHAVRDLLQSHHIHVACTGEATLALGLCLDAAQAGTPFDVLLCDVRLAQGEDGLDFAQALQTQCHPAPRVVMVTGETSPHNLRRLRESDVEVLFKPVTERGLLRALSQPPGAGAPLP